MPMLYRLLLFRALILCLLAELCSTELCSGAVSGNNTISTNMILVVVWLLHKICTLRFS
jgi:hypothetical protein